MGTLPLERHELFRSNQPSTRRLHDLTIDYIAYGLDTRGEPDLPETCFTIQIPVVGTAEVRCDSGRVRTTPERGAVISPTEHLDMSWSAGCVQLVCRIERPALEDRLRDIIGTPLDEPIRFRLDLDVRHGHGAGLKAALTTLADDQDRPGGLIAHPLVAAQFEHTLMSALLLGQQNNYTSTIRRRPAPG